MNDTPRDLLGEAVAIERMHGETLTMEWRIAHSSRLRQVSAELAADRKLLKLVLRKLALARELCLPEENNARLLMSEAIAAIDNHHPTKGTT